MLGTEDIVRGILSARKVAPLTIDEAMLNRYVDMVRNRRIVLKQDGKAFENFKQSLTETGLFVTDTAKQDLNKIAVYILPLPICLAYSEVRPNDVPTIVISSGFVDIVASSIFLSQCSSILPKALDTFYALGLRKDMSVNSIITNAIFLLQVHFYRYGLPLPNLRAILSEKQIADAKVSINGAITFILLHELAHIKLGHLETFPDKDFSRPTYVVPENMDAYKYQEQEADIYAMNCIKDEAKVIGTYWQQHAMSFFMSLELVSGGTLGIEHPMAINRNFNSDLLREEWGKEFDIKPRQKFYEAMAQRYIDTSRTKTAEVNEFINTRFEACWANIICLKDLYLEHNIDLSKLYSSTARSWF